MLATKHDSDLGANGLGDRLERLLAAYSTSVGGSTGVPAEVLQSATQIDPAHAPFVHEGPNESVAGDSGDEEAPRHSAPLSEASAAVIDGGLDNRSPLQLWDSVMRK